MLLASVVLTFPTGSDPSSRQRLPVVATVRTAVVETSDMDSMSILEGFINYMMELQKRNERL